MLATTTKKRLSMKGLVKTLRQRWTRGTFTDFDKLLSEIAQVNLENASRIRESWLDIDLVAYDANGFLVWYNGYVSKEAVM